MSVISTVPFALVVAVMLVSMPMATHAQNVRYIIRHATQLTDDKSVRRLKDDYVRASGANVLYAQCASQLLITDGQQQFLAKHFADTSTNYMKAFDTAFRERTGGPSTKELIEDYASYMRSLQQKAVNDMAAAIEEKGCYGAKLKKVVAHYHELQQIEEASQPAAAAVTH